MKKLVIFLISTSLLFSSCSNEEKIKSIDENDSPLQALEKEKGANLFNKDLELKDENGSNSMIIRISSFDKTKLDNYLKLTEYSILPITEKSEIFKNNKNNNKISDKSVSRSETDIYTEIISEIRGVGVIGLMVNVKSKKPLNSKAKVNFSYHASHQGPQWCENLYVSAYNNPVQYWIDAKNTAWSGWYTRMCCVYQTPSTIVWDIDGPRWSELEIDFDDYQNYSFWFQNLD